MGRKRTQMDPNSGKQYQIRVSDRSMVFWLASGGNSRLYCPDSVIWALGEEAFLAVRLVRVEGWRRVLTKVVWRRKVVQFTQNPPDFRDRISESSIKSQNR